jgi:hypothetical protein
MRILSSMYNLCMMHNLINSLEEVNYAVRGVGTGGGGGSCHPNFSNDQKVPFFVMKSAPFCTSECCCKYYINIELALFVSRTHLRMHFTQASYVVNTNLRHVRGKSN